MSELLKSLRELLAMCREFQDNCPITPVFGPDEELNALSSPCTQLPCIGSLFRYAGRQFRRGMNDVDNQPKPQ